MKQRISPVTVPKYIGDPRMRASASYILSRTGSQVVPKSTLPIVFPPFSLQAKQLCIP